MHDAYPFKQGDLFALTVFLTVAAHRSFHAAAVELEVTPSAVSHSIKNLEQRLGVRLFNRTTRSVAPTEAGERLAAQLRPALSSISQALHEVDEWRTTPSGTVRINASEGAVRLVLRPLLADFLRAYPHIHLDIVCDGKLSDIVAEGFDAGIRLADAVPQDMIAMRVSPPVRFAVIAAPGYFADRGRPATPQDLLHHNCIRFRFDSGTIYRWEFERDGVSESIGVTGSLTLTDQPLMVDAAIDGIGIAFVPEHLALEALHDGRLARALDAWCPAYPGLCLYYSGHRHVSGALKALIGYLRAAQP